MGLIATPTHSSLALQKALYFNSVYAPAFGLAHMGLAVYKIAWLQADVARAALPLCLVVWTLSEVVRLRLGYAGNLRERVSELSAFWLLSIVPTLPTVLYLTFLQQLVGEAHPLDLALGIPMLALLLSELHLSLRAARVLIARQTEAFYKLVVAPTGGGTLNRDGGAPIRDAVHILEVARIGARHLSSAAPGPDNAGSAPAAAARRPAADGISSESVRARRKE